MSNIDLKDIISRVEQPTFDDEMIKKLVDGMKSIGQTMSFYDYIQKQTAIENNVGAIDKVAEQELWNKKTPGFNQKGQFRHMGSLNDIDYVISRLYINCNKQDLMQLAKLFVDKCDEREIPSYFKYCSNKSNRSDQMVIYSNLKELDDYIQILQEIGKENPEMIERCGQPPLLTGKIDKWIGIGDEPLISGSSFTGERVDVIENVLKKVVPRIEEDGFTIYKTEELDYDLIREELKRTFAKRGINIDTLSFNNKNLQLYMSDEQTRTTYDEKQKQKAEKRKQEIEKDKREKMDIVKEQINISEIKLLKQMGIMPDAMDSMISATTERYGFLSDIYKVNVDSAIIDMYGLNSLNCIITDELKIQVFRGHDNIYDLPPEIQEKLASKMLTNVKDYYLDYFANEQMNLKETLNRYKELSELPRNENEDLHIEKTDLYTKLKLLSEGKAFFESIGISKENIELVCDTVQDFLQKLEQEKSETKNKDNVTGREFLQTIFEEAGTTDVSELRKIYEKHKDFFSDISDEDLDIVLSNFGNNEKIFTEQEIGKATIDRETTRKDKAQSQEKQDEQEIVNVKEDESQLD